MTEEETGASRHRGHAAWLASGLKIQELQYGFGSFIGNTSDFDTNKLCRLSLKALVRKIGSHPTPDQKKDLALKRSRLQDKIDAFQRQAGTVLHAVSNDGDDSWGDECAREIYTGAEFDGIGEKDDDGHDSAAEEHYQMQFPGNSSSDGHINAEDIQLHLPSHLGCTWCDKNAAKDLRKAELRLQVGQLNDSLHHIRIALGHKSYVFRNDVQLARTQRLKTCAWAEVHAVESTVQHHAWVYNHTWHSMPNLSADDTLLSWYKVLEHQDLKIDTTVIIPDVCGQQNKSLPWF